MCLKLPVVKVLLEVSGADGVVGIGASTVQVEVHGDQPRQTHQSLSSSRILNSRLAGQSSLDLRR